MTDHTGSEKYSMIRGDSFHGCAVCILMWSCLLSHHKIGAHSALLARSISGGRIERHLSGDGIDSGADGIHCGNRPDEIPISLFTST